jgi:hypothetical protein
MEGTKKKTGGFVRAFCNYNTPFSVASTSTQSAQDENENNATYKSCDNDFHTMSKAFNFMNPNSRGNPYNIPPKWLDDEPVPDSISPIPMNFRVQGEPLQDPPTGLDDEAKAKDANDDVVPPLGVGGKSTQCNKDNIHWTSQQKNLSDLEGFSAGAPDGIDDTGVIRSPRSRGSRGENYTYLLIYVGVLV